MSEIKFKLKEVLDERIKLLDETQDEWDYGLKECWKKEVDILTKNMNETLSYLDNECTEDEYGWLSEIFDDVVKKDPSKEFVDALYRLAEKYPKETKRSNIMPFIEDAGRYVDLNNSRKYK